MGIGAYALKIARNPSPMAPEQPESEQIKPAEHKKSFFIARDAHWVFFETIDEDLHAYSKYLEFHDDNFPAFSINLARLYLSICSEVDVVAKMICDREGHPTKRSSIKHYRRVITKRYPAFAHFGVLIRPMRLVIWPWSEWKDTADQNPPWWNEYNDVKHERNTAFNRANLGNVIHSAAGLLVMLVYLYGDLIQNRRLKPNFRILELYSSSDLLIVTGQFLLENLPEGFLFK
jgi:hypothetical protein